jgi:hypothetical protein
MTSQVGGGFGGAPGGFGRGPGGPGGFAGLGGLGAAYASAIAIDLEGQRQYVQMISRALIGISATDGKFLWRYDKPANGMGLNCSTPLYHDGMVFAASAYGAGGGLVKLSKTVDGGVKAEEVYATRKMQNHHGGMILLDGCLYGANGGNEGGYLICLDFKTGNGERMRQLSEWPPHATLGAVRESEFLSVDGLLLTKGIMRIFAAVVRYAVLGLACVHVVGIKAEPEPAPGLQDVSPAQPDIPAKTFNLDDFGGRSDGIASNTDAFRGAITSVEGAGGGTLIVRAGIYVTGAFRLCSRINLHLNAGALILFSPSEFQMENAGAYPALLMATNAHDIMISGAGTIFGSGDAWWPTIRESKRNRAAERRRPHLVYFDSCQRVRIEGVTLTHAPAYNLVPFRCADVTIEGIAIYNPADDNPETDGVDPAQVRKQLLREYADDSPNTDGIDPIFCQRLLISHCTIDTGDDGIAISSGASESGLSRDILVTDCTFLHGHGCSIGSETRGEIRGITVRRCVFEGTKVGIHLKSARGRGGSVNGILCSDLTMNHVGEAILITSYYPLVDISIYYRPYLKKASIDLANGGPDGAQPITAETPHWHDITLRNISATCTWDAGLIQGLPEMPAESLLLDHVSIEAPEGLHINYARHVVLHDVNIEARHGRSLIPGAGADGLPQ